MNEKHFDLFGVVNCFQNCIFSLGFTGDIDFISDEDRL